jgi:hypothetical protein
MYLLLSIILLVHFTAPLAEAVVTPPITKCFVEVHNAHISGSIFKREGRRAVKVNATANCNVTQNNVVLTVEIYKEGLGAPHLVVKKSTLANHPKSQGLVIKNQFTYRYCSDRRRTRYFGVAYSQAIINGKTYRTLPVRSENIMELDCGT